MNIISQDLREKLCTDIVYLANRSQDLHQLAGLTPAHLIINLSGVFASILLVFSDSLTKEDSQLEAGEQLLVHFIATYAEILNGHKKEKEISNVFHE